MESLLDFKNKSQEELNPYMNEDGFKWACRYGHLDVAQMILSTKPDINISVNDEYVFRWACTNGHSTVIEWLLSMKSDINISANNEYAFRYACWSGHLKIAQWLLSIKPDIDISLYNEFVFRSTCENGHFAVAEWLLSMKPDINISVNNDYAFRYTCRYGHFDIAQWLCTLNADYQVNVENSRIIYWNINKNINYVATLIINTNEICCVCYDPATLKTDCNHYGCDRCFIKLNNKCPYCRQEIDEYYKIELKNEFNNSIKKMNY